MHKICCTHTTQTVVAVIVFGLLDAIPADDGLVSVAAVLLVVLEVDLLEQLLLVILEFSDHLDVSSFLV